MPGKKQSNPPPPTGIRKPAPPPAIPLKLNEEQKLAIANLNQVFIDMEKSFRRAIEESGIIEAFDKFLKDVAKAEKKRRSKRDR